MTAVDPTPKPDTNRRLHIFISYRREDSSGQTGRLYDSLSEHFGADNVFMDLDTIEPGEDFVEVIDEALSDCDCVLVVIGPRWLLAQREGQRRLDDPADYLRIEVEHSLARAPRVIPVLVQDADMPRSADLPEAIRGLARRNAFDLSDGRWRLDVARLIAALEDIEASLGLGLRQATASNAATGRTAAGTTGSASRAGSPAASDREKGRAVRGAATRPVALVLAAVALIILGALGAYALTRGPANASPTATPTSIAVASGATASATPIASGNVPTASAGGASTPPRTVEPSSNVTPQPTPVRVLPAGVGLGAAALEFDDPFTASGGFPVSSDDRGSLGYADGVFRINVATPNYSLWSAHTLPAAHAVLSVRGSLSATAPQSFAGLMCGNTPGDYLYAAVGASGGWALGHILSNAIQTLETGALPVALVPTAGQPLDVRLDCAVTGAASDRMQLVVGGVKVADNSGAPRVGPFSRGALLGSSGVAAPATLTFDNLAIRSGESFREAPEALRAHVPPAWASHCAPTAEDGASGQTAALICAPAGAVDQGEYYQFETLAAMNTRFSASVAGAGGAVTGTDCHTGPSTSRYRDAQGVDAGSVACYANAGSMGGLLILWTNESLDIMSAGVLRQGGYDALATWWQTAGPVP